GSGNVAVVFGRESSGLNNEELELCNMAMQIPTDPDFSSLNVASAIQIICYELLQTILSGEAQEINKQKSPPATAEQMHLFYEHLAKCMTDIGYFDPEVPRSLMRRMKR